MCAMMAYGQGFYFFKNQDWDINKIEGTNGLEERCFLTCHEMRKNSNLSVLL